MALVALLKATNLLQPINADNFILVLATLWHVITSDNYKPIWLRFVS